MIDQSADDLYVGMHGGIVKRRPIGLKSVVHIDINSAFFVQHLIDKKGLVVENTFKKQLVSPIDFFVVVLPDGQVSSPIVLVETILNPLLNIILIIIDRSFLKQFGADEVGGGFYRIIHVDYSCVNDLSV